MENIFDIKMKIGFAADHGGYDLKEYLIKVLREKSYETIDFGNSKFEPNDDYPDYVVPLAKAISIGDVTRGIAICGSGVGVCIAANKISGVRACLIQEKFAAEQGVEDDDMNMLCLGGKTITEEFALELIEIFLHSSFTAAERHLRRLAKVNALDLKK